MSVSDEQCREIAKNLRDAANYGLGGLSLQRNLAEITKAEGVSWRWVMRRLAELIDRPKAQREDAGDYWRCRHCGAFTRMDSVTDCVGFIPARRCGNCGREWEL